MANFPVAKRTTGRSVAINMGMDKDHRFNTKVEPYLPVYARAPNRLLRYEERPFVCNAGYNGIERVAIFTDKNKKEQEMTAQVIWLDLPGS